MKVEREDIMNGEEIKEALIRMSEKILKGGEKQGLAFIGIVRRGDILAKRFIGYIGEELRDKIEYGTVDISLYRDDFIEKGGDLKVGETNILFDVSGKRIILVDDVLQTGRTIRAAIDQIMDYGRPKKIELAILVDRGGRELPICPNYCGKELSSVGFEKVEVKLLEEDGEEGVIYIKEGKNRI